MNESIRHRGPDASAFEAVAAGVGLGHVRLSIIDLNERSNQPIRIPNGEWTMVFNGEIINYREIRQQLSGYTFKTESDTEVLLAGLELKGIDWILERAEGMFAFCAFNQANRELLLVRDRLGIKPLFYSFQEGQLVFSSEVKGILHSGLVEAVCNDAAIDEYLGNRYVREPYTFFKNIYHVQSAHYIRFSSNGTKTEKRYWTLPPMNFEPVENEKKIIDKTEEKLVATLQKWFTADVTVGSYLSGGLDSSLTTAVLAQQTDQPITTYTIGFPDDPNNEFEYARTVSQQYGTSHHELVSSTADYFADWQQLIAKKDAPLGVPNEIPLAHMSSELKKSMTVVISGEGADELFGGYGRIFRSPFDFANHPKKGSFYDYFVSEYEYVHRSVRDKYLLSSMELREEMDAIVSDDFSKYRPEESVFRYFQNYHIKSLLRRLDMATMQASVEGRPPFLDHTLIDFVYREIPYDLKLKWKSPEAKQQALTQKSNQYSEMLDTPKYLLKKVGERHLPSSIVYRKKVGFPVPLNNWNAELGKWAAQHLQDAEWLRSDQINSLQEDLSTNARSGQLLWMFLNIQLFKEQYFNKSWTW